MAEQIEQLSEERANKRPRQNQGKKIEHLLQELHLKGDDLFLMLEGGKREGNHLETEGKHQSEYHKYISKNFHKKSLKELALWKSSQD